MASLKDIRRRITSVKNTQKITKAMKLVSAAKLRRAQDAMNELKPYAGKHRELLESLVAQLGGGEGTEAPHPLLAQRDEVTRVGVLVLSSDRGMCGGFNSGVQKALQRFKAEQSDDIDVVKVYTVGRRVGKFAEKRDFDMAQNFGEIIPVSRDGDEMTAMTQRLVTDFLSGELDEVYVLYNIFRSAIAQEPESRLLLPVGSAGGESPSQEDDVAGDLIYEPSQTALLAYIVPRYVEVQVRAAVLESVAGEHAARMNAMNSATDNASEMIRALTLKANRARQAAITTELMEIIGGAEALS
jgi:F-type H+-transporting ATPase subunit gamma